MNRYYINTHIPDYASKTGAVLLDKSGNALIYDYDPWKCSAFRRELGNLGFEFVFMDGGIYTCGEFEKSEFINQDLTEFILMYTPIDSSKNLMVIYAGQVISNENYVQKQKEIDASVKLL